MSLLQSALKRKRKFIGGFIYSKTFKWVMMQLHPIQGNPGRKS